MFWVLWLFDHVALEFQDGVTAYQDIPLFIFLLKSADQLINLASARGNIVLFSRCKQFLI